MKNFPLNKIGLTILEVILATAIFSLLMGLVFYIFSVSAGSWLKVRQTVEIKESSQIILTRLEKEIRGTTVHSILTKNRLIPGCRDAISFLSAFDSSTGLTDYNAISGMMKWKKFVIFYLRDDPSYAKPGYYQLCSREVDLGIFKDRFSSQKKITSLPYTPDKHENEPLEFATYFTMAKDDFISAPRPVARNITYLDFDVDYLTASIEISIKTGKPVKPNDPLSEDSPEKFEFNSFVTLKNR